MTVFFGARIGIVGRRKNCKGLIDMSQLLEIKGLRAGVEEKELLHGVNLSVGAG